jgi:hypothetical protein
MLIIDKDNPKEQKQGNIGEVKHSLQKDRKNTVGEDI